jgi:hypothetical protein
MAAINLYSAGNHQTAIGPGGVNRSLRSAFVATATLSGGGTPPIYYQRIYDTSLGQYVTYTSGTITTTPAPAETVPNHTGTGNLDAATHEIL